MEFFTGLLIMIGLGLIMSILMFFNHRSALANENHALKHENRALYERAQSSDDKYAALLDSLKEDCLLNVARRLREMPIVAGKEPYLELYRTCVALTVVLMEADHIRSLQEIRGANDYAH